MPPTLRVPAHVASKASVPTPAAALGSWDEIDGAWEDLDTEVAKAPASALHLDTREAHAGPARTLVGMGAIELFDDDDTLGSSGTTQPLAVVADEVTLPRHHVLAPPPVPKQDAPKPLGALVGPPPPAAAPRVPLPPSPAARAAPAKPAEQPSHLPSAFDITLPAGDAGSLPTMPLERVVRTGRFARDLTGVDTREDVDLSAVETSEVEVTTRRRQRDQGGLPTLPPEGLPDFGKGLPTLEMAGAPNLAPSFSVAAFDDLSVPPSADERSSEAKTLPPLSAPAPVAPTPIPPPVVEDAPTERRPALSPAALPPPDDSAFADTTMDARPGRPMLPVRQSMSVGLIALWVVAVAATVAAVLLVLLK